MQSLPLPLLLQSSPSPHLMLHDSQSWKIFNLCCAVCKVLSMNRFVCRALSTAVGVPASSFHVHPEPKFRENR